MGDNLSSVHLDSIYENILSLHIHIKAAVPAKNLDGMVTLLEKGAELGHFFGYSGLDGFDFHTITEDEEVNKAYDNMVTQAVNEFPEEIMKDFAFNSDIMFDWSTALPKLNRKELQKYIDKETQMYIEEDVTPSGAAAQVMDNLEDICGKVYTYIRNGFHTIDEFLRLVEMKLL